MAGTSVSKLMFSLRWRAPRENDGQPRLRPRRSAMRGGSPIQPSALQVRKPFGEDDAVGREAHVAQAGQRAQAGDDVLQVRPHRGLPAYAPRRA